MEEKMFKEAIGGRYRIVKSLGSGGIGKVYQVEDLLNHSTLALKTTTVPHDEVRALHLQKEFYNLSELRHPHIIQVNDFGQTEEGYSYFTMEYISGKSLINSFSKRDFSYKRTLELLQKLLLQICYGLQQIHQRGWIHGDLKPENILVDERSQKPHVTLLDFGWTGDPTVNVGTLEYAAPEILKGTGVDGRADVYSLGILLYELITGEKPYKEKDINTLMRMILTQDLPSPRTVNSYISEELDSLIQKSIEKEPGARWNSVEEVIDILTGLTTGKKPSRSSVIKEQYLTSRPFLSTKFIGREKFIDKFTNLLKHTKENKGGTILFTGERGVGKSRLIQDLKLKSQLNGVKVIHFNCFPHSSGEQLIHRFSQQIDIMEKVEKSNRNSLEKTKKNRLKDSDENHDLPETAIKFRIFDDITNRFLRNIQKNSPVIILIDDLQFADPFSQEYFTFLSRRILKNPILLISTREIIPNTANSDFNGGGSEFTFHHPLTSFTQEETRFFVSNLLGINDKKERAIDTEQGDGINKLIKWIFKETGGNPLLIEETMKLLLHKAILQRNRNKWKVVVEDLSKIKVDQRVEKLLVEGFERLTHDEKSLMNVASIIDFFSGSFDLNLLQKIFTGEKNHHQIGLDNLDKSTEHTFYRIITQLESQNLIRKEKGTYYTFSKGWLGRFLYKRIKLNLRRDIHRTIFKFLNLQENFRDEKVEVLAHHALLGETEEGIDLALKAADKAKSQYALDKALYFYEKCLDVLKIKNKDLKKEIISKIPILESSGDLYNRKGDYAKALEKYQNVLSLQSKNGVKSVSQQYRQAKILRKIGKIYQNLSSYDRALTFLAKAKMLVEASEMTEAKSEMMAILNEMAWSHRCQGEFQKSVKCCEKALNLGREKRDSELLSQTYYIFGASQWNQGKLKEAINYCNQSLKLGKSQYRKAIAYGFMGLLYYQKREFDHSYKCYEKSLEIQRSIGDIPNQASTLINIGILAQEEYNWEKALKKFDAALSLADRLDTPKTISSIYVNLGSVHFENGEWNKSLELFKDSLRMREMINDLSGASVSKSNTANLLIQMGNFDEGIKDFLECIKIQKKINAKNDIALSYLNLFDGYMGKKNWKRAQKILDKSRVIFEEENDERNLCWVYISQAELFFKMSVRNIRNGRDMLKSAFEFSKKGLYLARKTKNRRAEGAGLRILGQTLSRLEENESSSGVTSKIDSIPEDLFKESIAIFRKLRIPFELGKSLLEFGEFEIAKSTGSNNLKEISSKSTESRSKSPQLLKDARDHLKESLKIFKNLGAVTYLERARTSVDSITEAVLEGQWGFAGGDKYLKAFYNMSNVILAIQDEKNLLERILDLAIELLGAERGLLLLKNEITGELFFAAGRNVDEETLEDATRISRTITKGVAKSGRPVISSDAIKDTRFQEAKSVFLHKIRSLLCVPLICKKNIILGTLYLDSRVSHNLFSEEDESFLIAIANFIAVSIERSRLYRALQDENLELKRRKESRVGLEHIIGDSPEMEEVYKMSGKIAQDDCTVLITGETGTGKGLLAKAIHDSGKRGKGRFLTIHCGALPHHLLESELFGHKKGAFTDAVEEKPGLFEEANRGTIFLDEIGDAPLSVQTKLLHVLEDGAIRRIGETKERKVDVRILCATRRNLEEEIRSSRFREDLYFRLNVFQLHLPPLRDREEDIPLLAHHFLRESSDRHQKQILGFKPNVIESFVRYPWPGNVRELMHAIERAVIMTNGSRIVLDDIKSEVREIIPSVIMPVRAPEPSRKEEIEIALRKSRGNVSRAARELGITYRHLRRLILKFGLEEIVKRLKY
jgi:transcriptional regulator with GAF, ATPase, and Fis domain/Tfp pilus assembly protein PilF